MAADRAVTSAKRRMRRALFSVGALVLLAALAPLLAPWSPTAQPDIVGLRLHAPDAAHLFGTDPFSRDVLSRVLYGARVSLSIAVLAALLSATVGVAYGLVSGWVGGRTDAVMMRVVDALLAIPRVLLLLAVLALWSPVPVTALVVVLAATGWFGVSRLVRAEVLALREREFVAAARALGAGDVRIVVRHLLPNVIAPVTVAATLAVANLVGLEAGLSYLGIGVREPTPSWGAMIQSGTDAFAVHWWMVVFPGLAIVATVLAFNALGDALRDALTPGNLGTMRANETSHT